MGQLVSDVTKILDYNNAKKIAAIVMNANPFNKVNLIKKVLSTQRAKYGADGNSGDSFSENAVLKRLRNETAQPYDDKKQENIEKIRKNKIKKPNLIKNWLAKLDDIAG